jgi:hypothetical protein
LSIESESEIVEKEMEHGRLPQEQGDTSAALSDLARWIAILAAPHGYGATARLLGGARGNRLLLQARGRSAEHEYVEEVSLESLESLGAVAVGSAFDRAARAAFAAADRAEPSLSRPAQG